MSQAIVITSGKGGVGKSSLCVNLGVSLAEKERKVVLLDMDIGLRNLDVLLGLENRIVYDLVDVEEGTCRLKQALVRDPKHEGLYLLAAAQTRDSGAISPRQMQKVILKLKEQFEYVLLDCPAGIGRGFKNAVAGADEAIVVCVPDVVSIRDAERVMGLLERSDILHPRLIVNRMTPAQSGKGAPISVAQVKERLPMELLGVVPEDGAMAAAAMQGEPIVDWHSAAGEAFLRIARRIRGESVPIPEVRTRGMWARMMDSLSRRSHRAEQA